MKFFTWLLAYAAGVVAAAWLFEDIWFTGALTGSQELVDKAIPVAVVALVLGLVSTVIEPIVVKISFPFVLATLGLALLVINALMFMLAAYLAGELGVGFHVDGYVAALLGSIVVTIVGWATRTAIPGD